MKTQRQDIEWEILFIVLTSILPIWLFVYHQKSYMSFDKQVIYHLFSFPFYLLQYFFLYCFLVDFILSIVCNTQDNVFCEHNYDGIRYPSLFITIGLLILITVSQVTSLLTSPKYTREISKRKRKEKKRKKIRKSIVSKNKYMKGLGQGRTRQSMQNEEKRRMRDYEMGRMSLNTTNTMVMNVQQKIYELEQSDKYTSLKPIYDMIDKIGDEKNKKQLENKLLYAIERKIEKVDLVSSSTVKTNLIKMVREVRDQSVRYWMLRNLQ